jgi:16S rRNA (uracil1498-N3)-methyltransferase
MTHRFWIDASQLQAGEVVFTAVQTHQLRDVLRLGAGDRVQVFDGVTPWDVLVELSQAGRGNVVGEVPQAPEPHTRVVAYPSLLPRDKFESVLQKLTEVGAAAIAPVLSQRSLVRQAPDAGRYPRWSAIVREAAEQCGRGVVPRLLPVVRLEAALTAAEGTRILAYERERQRHLSQVLSARPERVAVFVGPEGGYTSDEAEYARAAGVVSVSLGPRLLRAETASPLLTALVLYELGDLSWTENGTR